MFSKDVSANLAPGAFPAEHQDHRGYAGFLAQKRFSRDRNVQDGLEPRLFKRSGRNGARIEAIDRSFV
jgi:hypothetical protein